MTRPYIQTQQFERFRSDLNKALPLAFTVRAVALVWPDKLEELQGLDAMVLRAWVAKGFTEEEVRDLGLTQLSWDMAQLGWSERRVPREVWRTDVWERMRAGLQPVHDECLCAIDKRRYPFAERFRYADLVASVDVTRVLRDYLRKKFKLRSEPERGGIPLGNFILSVKPPVPVVPGALQWVTNGPKHESEYLGIFLRYDMSADDIQAALTDFLYHYSDFRYRHFGVDDHVTNDLLNPWARPAAPDRLNDLVGQVNQIQNTLGGLVAYDRYLEGGGAGRRGARARAIEATQEMFPEHSRPDTNHVGKWLTAIRNKVLALAENFKNGPTAGASAAKRKRARRRTVAQKAST